VPASGAGANVLRIAGGAGVKLAKQAIASAEIRSDGMSTRGRHGTQQVTAAYSAEASLGALDPIIEAIMRSTWDTNVLTKTQADFTGLTTDVDGINLQAGNPIAMGFRVGDVIRATGLTDTERAAWREVPDRPGGLVRAADGALVLMAHLRFPAHIGVWLKLEARVIHCSEHHGVCCESVLALRQMGWKRLTFYEPIVGRTRIATASAFGGEAE
jgi:hypothetical protein